MDESNEPIVNYVLNPNLEHITLVKIAVALWNQVDIRALIEVFFIRGYLPDRYKRWQNIENKVIEKVPQLSLPGLFEEKILSFIKPIGLQIYYWMEYHNSSHFICIKLPDNLCWTSQGTIDKKKTAEVLIKNEKIDITRRYKLACIYCLENDIPKLWNNIPENHKMSLSNEKDPTNIVQQELVFFWTYRLKGEMAKLDDMIERKWTRRCSHHQYAFEYAAGGGNKAAVEYFLQKLTSKERKESLIAFTRRVAYNRCTSTNLSTGIPKGNYTEVLCFLLSQMNEEQRIKVFKSNPYHVLKCLLDWPWQNLFIKTAKRIRDFLSEEDYSRLDRKITREVNDGFKDYDYQEFSAEFVEAMFLQL